MASNNEVILAVNGGSSSIKFALFLGLDSMVRILSGQIKRIGLSGTTFTVTTQANSAREERAVEAADFRAATQFLAGWLDEHGYSDRISCVGHRVVHGLDRLAPEVVDDRLLEEMKKIRDYDLDHLPAEVGIMEFFRARFPTRLQVACFDTTFHVDMPRVAKMLPIPRRYDEAGIRRYGFHGLSYAYLMKALKKVGKPNESSGRIVLAHLGNGSSMTAVKNGKSLDTSMGFTPAGGLPMGTRTGDMDPGVAWYLMKDEQMTARRFNHLVNRESGLLGVSGTSSDMLELLDKEDTDIRAVEAVNLFCYQARKWVGAFAAVLDGIDTLVFSGGIGENAPAIRSRICRGLSYLGVELDEEENERNAECIAVKGGKVKVYVIPTDEEIMIASYTAALYLKTQG
ncbi:MAG: acetate/propionate family kinase [Bacteroidetes bacterium]|nr:acetate/propionate family kinase [Bacteroidota bacterium]